MTPAKLKIARDLLCGTGGQKRFAAILGVHPCTISRVLAGTHKLRFTTEMNARLHGAVCGQIEALERLKDELEGIDDDRSDDQKRAEFFSYWHDIVGPLPDPKDRNGFSAACKEFSERIAHLQGFAPTMTIDEVVEEMRKAFGSEA